jgi:hypothetical protein
LVGICQHFDDIRKDAAGVLAAVFAESLEVHVLHKVNGLPASAPAQAGAETGNRAATSTDG